MSHLILTSLIFFSVPAPREREKLIKDDLHQPWTVHNLEVGVSSSSYMYVHVDIYMYMYMYLSLIHI